MASSGTKRNVLEQVLESVQNAVNSLVMFATNASEQGSGVPNIVPGAGNL